MRCRSSSKIAPDQVGRTIGYDIGFVNSSTAVDGALKALEKPEIVAGISFDAGSFRSPAPDAQKPRICVLSGIYC
jgi:hypothetical protein